MPRPWCANRSLVTSRYQRINLGPGLLTALACASLETFIAHIYMMGTSPTGTIISCTSPIIGIAARQSMSHEGRPERHRDDCGIRRARVQAGDKPWQRQPFDALDAAQEASSCTPGRVESRRGDLRDGELQ